MIQLRIPRLWRSRLAGIIRGTCHIPPDIHGGYVWFHESDLDILGRLMAGLEPGGKGKFMGSLDGISASRPLTLPVREVSVFREERCKCFRVMFVPGVYAILDNFTNRLFRR